MKSTIKKIIPSIIWETLRESCGYTRRLFLDLKYTFLPVNPIEWARLFFFVRIIRPTYSMVPTNRLKVLYELSKKINTDHVPGDIVECGVYNGGSAAIMMIPQIRFKNLRDIWLFDSFEGLPPPTENDGTYEKEHYYQGWCKGSIEKVKEIFQHLRLPEKRFHLVGSSIYSTKSISQSQN